MLGVTWDGGRPSLDTNEIFSTLSFLKLNSIFKLNLFKFLRLLLDGELPIFWELLMAKCIAPHAYGTRRIKFRCPDITCEVERRALSYQLLMLLEKMPHSVLVMKYKLSIRHFKEILLEEQ